MSEWMVVAESKRDGTYWSIPEVVDTLEHAADFARSYRNPPDGYVWVAYKLDEGRELTGIT